MKKKVIRSTTIISAIICLTTISFAKEKLSFSYPELQVTPLASQRVKMEARSEKKLNSFSNIQQSVPGMMTLISGIMQFNAVNTTDDPNKNSAYAGTLVGAFWVASSIYINSKYRPYTTSYKLFYKLPVKTKRQQLVRERMAESEINKIGRYGKIMKWMNVLSNAGVSAYMLGKTEDGSRTKLIHGISLLTSFMPLLFENQWEKVKSEQKSYKKKIYAPLIGAGLLPIGSTGKFAPGAYAHITF